MLSYHGYKSFDLLLDVHIPLVYQPVRQSRSEPIELYVAPQRSAQSEPVTANHGSANRGG